jgi:hypothetical protein
MRERATPCLGPLAALDTLELPRTTGLLSAEEAKDRLREIVEGFFYRRRNEQARPPARHLLVRSPPGLGKTKEAMEWATRYQTEQEDRDGFLQMSRIDITAAGAKAHTKGRRAMDREEPPRG